MSKRIISILLFLVLCVNLSACGKRKTGVDAQSLAQIEDKAAEICKIVYDEFVTLDTYGYSVTGIGLDNCKNELYKIEKQLEKMMEEQGETCAGLSIKNDLEWAQLSIDSYQQYYWGRDNVTRNMKIYYSVFQARTYSKTGCNGLNYDACVICKGE